MVQLTGLTSDHVDANDKAFTVSFPYGSSLVRDNKKQSTSWLLLPFFFQNKKNKTKQTKQTKKRLWNRINLSPFCFTIPFIFACDNKPNQITKPLITINTCIWQEWIDGFCKWNWIWQSKYDAAPNQKSYLGLIASKYATLLNIQET
jgi:hypothetical protein